MKTVRVALLLAVLAAVVLYAVRDIRSRGARNDWQQTLSVALVLVTEPGVEASAVTELRGRAPELGRRLTEELHRYRPAAPAPFGFVVYGPTPLGKPLPAARGEALLDAARYAWDLHGFTSDIDARAGVPSRGFDARVYLVVQPPTDRALVEGMSEHGGRVGIARAELEHETIDLSLFVAAHELFHTLGADDHYGPDGNVQIPSGLAEPERIPVFPQLRVEIMARNRPLSESAEERLKSLDEVGVGPATAREIGWLER